MHLHAQVPYLYLFFWETKCLLPSTIQSQSPSSQCNWVILWDDNFVAQKSPFSRWISHYMHKVKEKSLVDLEDYFFHLYVTDSSSVIHKRWKEAHGNLCKQPKCQSGLAALHRLQLGPATWCKGFSKSRPSASYLSASPDAERLRPQNRSVVVLGEISKAHDTCITQCLWVSGMMLDQSK